MHIFIKNMYINCMFKRGQGFDSAVGQLCLELMEEKVSGSPAGQSDHEML